METAAVLTIALALLAIIVALFLVFRQVVLWYFRINERTELLRDIRDSLRQRPTAAQTAAQAVPTRPGTPPDENGVVHRWIGETDDNYNSRLADEMQRQRRG